MVFKIAKQIEINEYIGFSIAEQSYCINIENVQEIIYVPKISLIPNEPPYIVGAINLRGKIIKVYNLRKWFRLPWKQYTKDTQIIIIDLQGSATGLLVDKVYEVFRVDKHSKHEVPFLLSQQPEFNYAQSIIDENEALFIEIFANIFLETN